MTQRVQILLWAEVQGPSESNIDFPAILDSPAVEVLAWGARRAAGVGAWLGLRIEKTDLKAGPGEELRGRC